MRNIQIWKKRFLWLVSAIVFLSAYGTLKAADDGGGRSLFAVGAGNRALGLGGAYAALADDASAPLWNPGGLGLVERMQLQASQTNYYIGINEQYASLVYPHYRFGTFSTTFRRFGIDGIERRDDRNILMDDNITNSEIEWSVGYGRRMSDVWSLGGVLKVQHQSLAGYSGSGVGLDFGAIIRPLVAISPDINGADRLTFGLAFRNAIEPKITLLQESVQDPTGIRFGAAYRIPFNQDYLVLVAYDAERTRDMDTRHHFGSEVQLRRHLVLRGGVNNGIFTAGTGIAWNGLDVNYAFEDGELGNIHRIGLSLAFGPTVEESRQAALDEAKNPQRAIQSTEHSIVLQDN